MTTPVTPREGAALSIEDLRLGGRFLRGLPGFLRHPWQLDEARAAVLQRLERRGARFLALMARAVYGNPASPYRALLAHSGCAQGDLVRLVESDGVEGALHALAREGVYLTVEELKGRRPIRRSGLTVDAGPDRLRNPGARGHLALRSGGGRGAAASMVVDLAFMRETNANHRVGLAARGGEKWVHAVWDVPGGAALIRVLRLAGIGATPVRWFSQIDPVAAVSIRGIVGRRASSGGAASSLASPSPLRSTPRCRTLSPGSLGGRRAQRRSRPAPGDDRQRRPAPGRGGAGGGSRAQRSRADDQRRADH